MKKEITYNDLWLVEQDIEALKTASPALYLVNENKFLTILFGSKNKMHVQTLHKRLKEIQKKYILHDDEGNGMKMPPTEQKKEDWIYLHSVIAKNGELLTGEAVEKAYYAEAGEFLKRSVTIEF